jgi:RNA 2',3'-cyclic 3'-phosphodiesterase
MEVKNDEFIRCFVALDLSREVMDYISELQEIIKKQNLFTGKFTEVENLHLTLKFLGEIEQEKVEAVKNKLKEIKFPAFEVKLGNVGTFGERGYIRVIWAELIGAYNLQKQVDNALKDMFPVEERFMGHITIARVKNIKDRNALLDYLKKIKTKEIKFKVDKFFLKKSILQPDGPVYDDIEEYDINLSVN